MSAKILIVGPAWVGDMVMAQSLFKLIKQANPITQIDVLAPDWSRPVLQRMPEVQKSIALTIQHGQLGLRSRYQLAQTLKADSYDQAIVLANTWKSALIPFWAGINQRTGWLGECRWGLLNDVRYLNKKALPRMVQRYTALGLPKHASLPDELPIPELLAPKSSVATVLEKFSLQADQEPVLALCPGAAYGAAKRWPEEYFSEIAQQKLAAGWRVWLFGSEQDKPVIDAIQQRVPGETKSFAGQINLFETIDLMSTVTAVVSNDSGLMHMAASLGKRLVAIYGSTSPLFTPPLGQHAHILKKPLACSPCFERDCPLGHFQCMRQIKPQEVLEALDEGG